MWAKPASRVRIPPAPPREAFCSSLQPPRVPLFTLSKPGDTQAEPVRPRLATGTPIHHLIGGVLGDRVRRQAKELSALAVGRLLAPGFHAVGGVQGLGLQISSRSVRSRPASSIGSVSVAKIRSETARAAARLCTAPVCPRQILLGEPLVYWPRKVVALVRNLARRWPLRPSRKCRRDRRHSQTSRVPLSQVGRVPISHHRHSCLMQSDLDLAPAIPDTAYARCSAGCSG